MTTRSTFPLASLLEHTSHLVDTARLELANAVRAREAAEAHVERAEGACANVKAHRENVRSAERERLASGQSRVSDLTAAMAWEQAQEIEIKELLDRAKRAYVRLEHAQAREVASQRDVAEKKSKLDMLTKQKEKFVAAQQKQLEAAEEDAAEDVIAARHAARAAES